MYRLILESLLGIRLENGHLVFVPCLPSEWTSAEVVYRYKNTSYRITVTNRPDAPETEVWLDNVQQTTVSIVLEDDQKDHQVIVKAGRNKTDPEPLTLI